MKITTNQAFITYITVAIFGAGAIAGALVATMTTTAATIAAGAIYIAAGAVGVTLQLRADRRHQTILRERFLAHYPKDGES